MARILVLLATLFWSGAAFAQATLQQGGSTTQGHAPAYWSTGSQQPTVIDSGPAGGNTTGQGLSELNVTARGTGTAPYAGQGTGPNGETVCLQDAVSTNPTGYHFLCLSANAQGGGLLSYGAAGAASVLPLSFKINGTTYQFPFTSGYVVGPGTSTVGHMACWNNTAGTLLSDCGAAISIGGTNGQIQYNNAGALGGFTLGGDATVNTGSGALTVSKIGGQNISLGGALTTAGAFTTAGAVTHAGAFSQTLTATGNTSVTLPTSGTLATLAGSEALTNKTVNGLTINNTTGTLAITNGKTLTASNTLQFTGTDGSTLNVGTGGVLGTAAYTAASAYVPSNTQITNALGANVNLTNTSNYFTGPSVAQGASGTWFASGTVTLSGNAGDTIYCKLWDGTTVISSTAVYTNSLVFTSASLSGYLASPAGNIRISCRNISNTASTAIEFNASGNSKDSGLSAFRVN